MPSESMPIEPIAHVVGGRREPALDYWGAVRSIIRVDGDRVGDRATLGLETYSHLEVIFQFHLIDPSRPAVNVGHPRGNPDWPLVGVLAQRNMLRPNRVGLSRCKLLRVDGLDLHVEGLDAVDGTPVLDIKPWVAEFGPTGEVRQPDWSHELMANYFATAPNGRPLS